MLGLLKRYRYRKAARREAAERWDKLGDELQNNVDKTIPCENSGNRLSRIRSF